MTHVNYKIVANAGGWAYTVGRAFSQAGPTHPEALAAGPPAAASSIAASAFNLFAARPAAAQDAPPPDTGRQGRRYLIRGGSVMSMDPQVGDLVRGDVMVQGNRIQAIGPNLSAGNADVIDATGRIVMTGFIDTHHHQAWTAISISIPDS